MKYLYPVLCTILICVACDRGDRVSKAVEPERADTPAAVSAHKPTFKPWYSPFVVDLDSKDLVFDRITFKDVGTQIPTDDREPVMETLAEALATALEQDPTFKAQWNLRYDASLQKAESHLECESEHLYVDVWDGKGTWGYSLWSGCGENDNFAKGEAEIAQQEDPVDHVAPLVEAVKRDLHRAHQSKCFEKSC